MVVGVCRLALALPGVHSLKEKRGVVRRVLERTRQRFPVSAAEVGSLDSHDESVVAFAMVSNDGAQVDAVLERVAQYVESLGLAPVTRRATQRLHAGPFEDATVPRAAGEAGPVLGDWDAFAEEGA